MFASGREVGAYTIDVPVARGRSGTVYRAHAPDDRAVALKVHDSAEAAAAEIDCLRALEHPGIISLIEQAQLPDEGAWLALPWIEGETLGHLLEVSAPLSLDRTRRIITELADALDALHDAGFVHGDLAPSNILVDADDRVTIIDLATAKRLADSPEPLDRTTGIELETTPRFASPEVASGLPPAPSSDVYALTLIAYEALTGTSPFADVATPIAMLGHHASSIPDAPSEHRPDLPGAVEDALLAGLAKDPNDRLPSASAFARQLNNDGPGTLARPDNPQSSTLVRLGVLAVLAVVVLGALATFVVFNPFADDGTDASTGELANRLGSAAGDAASARCNLATNTGFETDTVPEHFYLGDTTNTTAIVDGGGVDDGAALRVGANGAFGIYGEIIPIGTDSTFILSAWLRRQGDPDMTTLYVDYLDADFDELTNVRGTALAGESRGTVEGERVLIFSEAPVGASYAVPTFFKDGSGGSLLIDEVIFGPENSCLTGTDS